MARPEKRGLDYFPFDVDFFEDEKIEAISGEFGIKGEIATIKLLCAVYRNGYFIQWSELLKMKLLKRLPGISIELLEQILNRLVKWGFFDKNLFDSDKILTSKGIQSRFFQATKRRKSSEKLPYLLINVNNNSHTDELMFTETSQRKGKESSTKEIFSDENKKKTGSGAMKAGQSGKLAAAKAATLSRKKVFYDSLIPHAERYSKELVREFFDYWSELNRLETKMRFEAEKAWEVEKRLAAWEKRERTYRKSTTNEQKEPEVYIIQ